MARGLAGALTSAGLATTGFWDQLNRVGAAASDAVFQSDAPKTWVAEHKPKISFTCVERLCSLASVWDGEGRDALVINSGARNRELAGATIVTLDAIKAD